MATSRAKDRLIILSDLKNLERLHQQDGEDDLYELIQYTRRNGKSQVTGKQANSRALGVKPFSSATEEAFLKNLNHALENIWLTQNRFQIQREVAVSDILPGQGPELFYADRFDFVVYEQQKEKEIPVLAIELEGREHLEEEVRKRREEQKQELCRKFDLQVIQVENSYARRYNHIKEILMNFFRSS